MATSGSANYSVSAADIINAAYRVVYNASSEYTLQGVETDDWLQALNMLVKNLMGPPNFLARGMKTWQREVTSLTLQASMAHDIKPSAYTFTFVDSDVTVADDTISETGHDLVTGSRVVLTTTGTLPAPLARSTTYYVIRVDPNTFKLATTGPNAADGTAIDITAAPITFSFATTDVSAANDTITETAHGLVTGDAITLSTTGTLPDPLATSTTYYVIRDDADTFKLATTAANATAGTQINITDTGSGTHTLTGGGTITVTQTIDLSVNIPVELLSVNYKDISNDSETPLDSITYEEWFAIGNKTNRGNPSRYYYERRLDRGRIFLDTIPSAAIVTAADTLEIAFLTPLEDFDATANDPYFPQEWYRPLKWMLAQEMHPEAGKIVPADVASLAAQSIEAANTTAPEKGDSFFQPERD